MNISLCIMVKDEVQELENCLKAFQPLVKEIVVLDTGQCDEINTLTKKLKVKRVPFVWVDDFAVARNEIIQHAKEEWIMMVDADDTISPESIKILRANLEKLEQGVELILLPYIYTKTGHQAGSTAYLPRLWKRSLGLKYIYPIHEYLDVSNLDKSKIKYLNIPIIHQKKFENISKSFERNLKLIKKYLETNPQDLRMLYYLVHDSEQIKNYSDVILGAQKYVEANPKDLVKTFKVLIRKGKAHVHLNHYLEAQEAFLLAISVQPLLIESYLELGNLYKKRGLFKEAEHFYRCALLCKKPEQSFDFHNAALYDFFAMKKLTHLLKEMGKYEEALHYAKKLSTSHPEDEKLKAHIKVLESMT